MKPLIYILFCALLFSFNSLAAEEIHSAAILVDVSKSVSPQEFERIKSKIQGITGQQTPSSLQLELYIFGDDLQKISTDQLRSIGATQSNTIFYDAVYDVLQDLEKGTSVKKSIVIFSDGKDTKSATTLDDIVSYAREKKIVIHCVGTGKANQRLLERLAKLTGGKYFAAGSAALVEEIRNTIDVKPVPQKAVEPPAVIPRSSRPVPASSLIKERSHSLKYLYGGIAGLVALIVVGGVVLYRLRQQKKRSCPTCGKSLEPSQLVCSDCPGQTQIQPRPEIPPTHTEPAPVVLPPKLQSGQETQEFLSKTYFLDDTPTLVVTKGTNVGERYRMSKDHPVSIGRSRLNEIRPEDPSISAQHCRIIPENGEYVIYDLGSTNGTVVNNVNVNMAVLEEGDTIRVGSTTLLFTLAGS